MAHVFGTSKITHSKFVYTSWKHKSLNHKVGLIHCYNVKNQSSSYLSMHYGTCFWYVKNRSLRIRSHQFETQVTKSQSLFTSLLQRQKPIVHLSVNAFVRQESLIQNSFTPVRNTITKSQSLFTSLLQRQKPIIELSVKYYDIWVLVRQESLTQNSFTHVRNTSWFKVVLIHCYNVKNQPFIYLSLHYGTCFDTSKAHFHSFHSIPWCLFIFRRHSSVQFSSLQSKKL